MYKQRTDMRSLLTGLTLFLIPVLVTGQDSQPLMHWGFEKIENRNLMETSGSIADTIEGNFEPAPGVSGSGLRFDGFTTCVKRSSSDKTSPGDEFTVEAKIHDILRTLLNRPSIYLNELFNKARNKMEIVATFLAILELIRLQEIVVQQKKLFDDIIIKRFQQHTQPHKITQRE